MAKQAKQIRRDKIQPHRKRFLINAIILTAAFVMLILKMPTWGIAQVVILVIIAVLAGFQYLLFLKLK